MKFLKLNLINFLRNLIKNDKTILFAKATVFVVFLLLANRNWFLFLLFILLALCLYFRPLINSIRFLASFSVLMACSIIFIFSSITAFNFLFFIVCFFGFIFFILLGIKNLVFIKREPFYYFLNGLLVFIVFVFFFWLENESVFFFIKYFVSFMAFFFLLKEFLSFSLPDLSFSSKKKLIIWGISFLVIQLLWVISLLPINFLNAASFTLLIALILQDFIVQFSKGTINRQIILRNATVFLILSLIIFGASKWTP